MYARPPIQRLSGFSWSKLKEASEPSKENHRRFFRPGETWLITTAPQAPWSVSNNTVAASSVPTAVEPDSAGRRSNAVSMRAISRVIRWPVANSIRSHQCTPMSPNAREAPPSCGSIRQLLSSRFDSQSCK